MEAFSQLRFPFLVKSRLVQVAKQTNKQKNRTTRTIAMRESLPKVGSTQREKEQLYHGEEAGPAPPSLCVQGPHPP